MLARLKARGMPVLLAGMRARAQSRAPTTRRFDAIFPDLAQKHGVPLYPFFLDGVAGDRRAQPAGRHAHPTAAGVAEIVRRILPAVSAALAKSTP